MELADIYEGREATAVKHAILRRYLQKLAYKVGSWCPTLNYVEGFAGPWNARTDDLSDTSPHIAIAELRSARDGLAKVKIYGRRMRCLFCEKDAQAAQSLRDSLDRYNNLEAIVIEGEFLPHIDDIRLFTRDPVARDPRFTFLFVDPTGWTKYDPELMVPLLRDGNTEVLVNFMTKDIIRFVNHPSEGTRETFDRLFGPGNRGRAWDGLRGYEREEAIVAAFCARLGRLGNLKHVVSAIVLYPTKARTYFHLIHGTRSDDGLRTFRQAERDSLREHVELREIARQRERVKRTHQAELLPASEMGTHSHLELLRDRYRNRARAGLVSTLQVRRSAPV
jgi:three-Cys-motif partner protein